MLFTEVLTPNHGDIASHKENDRYVWWFDHALAWKQPAAPHGYPSLQL